jgi:hypothetical protein
LICDNATAALVHEVLVNKSGSSLLTEISGSGRFFETFNFGLETPEFAAELL